MTHPPIIADSGAPEGSTDYTTVVLFHGYAWTSDAFRKMLPLARASNARIILADRLAKTDPDAARAKILAWMRERAREIYDLLVHIVREHKIPLARPEANAGGIAVGGWSFGTAFLTALLANMVSFPVGDVDLRKYLRRVVFLDPPDFALGLPLQTPIPEIDALPTSAQRNAIALFYSGYFKHGDVNNPATYSTAAPLPASKAVPTWNRLTPEEIETMNDPVPGDVRGGTDSVLMRAGISAGSFDILRQEALHLSDLEGNGSAGSWDAVEVRHVLGRPLGRGDAVDGVCAAC